MVGQASASAASPGVRPPRKAPAPQEPRGVLRFRFDNTGRRPYAAWHVRADFYLEAAKGMAVCEKLGAGTCDGEIPAMEGVMAFGANLRQCETAVWAMVEDWLLDSLMIAARDLVPAILCFTAALACGGVAVAADAGEPKAHAFGSAKALFNVREYGAFGDGMTLDTPAINGAIEACAAAGGGQVLLPPGRYLSGTLRLRSRVTLFLDAGATLVGTTNLSEYQQPTPPAYLPEARWGKWHRGLMVGEGLEDVTIAGPGTIDGNKVFDPTGEERMRGPHTIVFVNCRRFTLRDVSIVDSANYAVFFQVSDDVEVRNVKFTGGWDGVHFRGAPQRWCTNVTITGCQFYTGDDGIAGRYWDQVVISDCLVNSSCNGLRLIGPATRLIVRDCLFYGPGRQPHRTSGAARRSNMLSGIILQPGAWDRTQGLLDDVLIADVTMHNVASPVTLWIKGSNTVGRVTVSGLDATGVYRSALSAESWADTPITNLVLRNAHIEFAGGGRAEQAGQPVKGPGVDARPLPAWGFYARHVERVTFEDVRLSLAADDLRPVFAVEKAGRLDLDSVRFTRVAGVTSFLMQTNLGALNLRETDLAPPSP